MIPRVTIRRTGWLLALTAICAGLFAGDPLSTNGLKTSGDTKSSLPASSSVSSKSASEAKSASDPKSTTSSLDHETFAEPYRTVQVATTDLGIVREVLVREGDEVEPDQPLVKLDDELVKASLAIAQQNLESRGTLNSAEAELRLHTSRVEKFEALVKTGHARSEELDRARMERDVSAARVLTAQETNRVRQRELERIQIELQRRTVKSPIQGVISKLHREVGEFVAPTDPVVITMVQLDPLLATFSLKPAQANLLRVGQPVQVRLASLERPVNAEVELVSPMTDARSGTVRVKVRIPNPQRLCRSGDRCTLLLGSPAQPQAASHERDKSSPAKRTR